MTDTLHTYIADFSGAAPEIVPESTVSKTVLKNEDITLVMFSFDAGQELTEHTSSHPAIIHILQGEAKLTLGHDEQQAAPGAWAYMPPNLPHSIVAQTPLVMALMMLNRGPR